jgi:hypothetical protein
VQGDWAGGVVIFLITKLPPLPFFGSRSSFSTATACTDFPLSLEVFAVTLGVRMPFFPSSGLGLGSGSGSGSSVPPSFSATDPAPPPHTDLPAPPAPAPTSSHHFHHHAARQLERSRRDAHTPDHRRIPTTHPLPAGDAMHPPPSVGQYAHLPPHLAAQLAALPPLPTTPHRRSRRSHTVAPVRLFLKKNHDYWT